MKVILLCLFVTAASALAPLYTSRDAVPGRYIVKLKTNADLTSVVKTLSSQTLFEGGATVTKKYKKVFNGFAATLSKKAVSMLQKLDVVEYIEEDSIVKASSIASWGLDRIDQTSLPLDDVYQPLGDGSGIHVYVIDTGVNDDHVDFSGRASTAFDATGGSGLDCNGHGTHCAGTVAGDSYGVAKGCQVYGVKVLNCFGSGYTSDIVSACDWVIDNGNRPAIGSMSLGGGASTSMDAAVAAMIADGIQVAVAAGNDDANACNYSPARSGPAITVGATDIYDQRAYFSNYGTCVDIFAPGVDITSAWIGGTTATNTISGTSMACPHVAGAAAILLANDTTLTPSALKSLMQTKSIGGAISDAGSGSPNLLLYIADGNGGGGSPTDPEDPVDPVDPGVPGGCGGFFNVSGSTFSSPNYPSDYNNGDDCAYVIEAPADKVVQLTFTDFNVESHSTCNYDAVKVYDGSSSSGALLANLCGSTTPAAVYSSGNQMYVTFTSDSSVTYSGFSATVSFVDESAKPAQCGDTLTKDSGDLTSPGWPDSYENNEVCEYFIQGSSGQTVSLSFSSFDLEYSSTCQWDYVEVRDGSSASSSLLATLCGSTTPSTIYSTGSGLYVKFYSDSSVTAGGFSATYNLL